MARPIWNGTISFGLLNVPVQLQAGEEVPWKDVAKAFEYEKGSYVVVDEEHRPTAAGHCVPCLAVIELLGASAARGIRLMR